MIDIDFDAAAAVAGVLHCDEEHRYTLNGRPVAGCTGSLEEAGLDDWSMVPKHILHAAQLRGTKVHIARHLDDDDDLDESSVSGVILGHLNGWRAFRKATGFTPILSEQPIFAPEGNPEVMPCGGTLDAVGIVPDPPRLVLADLKTGSVLPKGVGAQTAGYALMLRLLGICDVGERWAVQTNREGGFKVTPQAKLTDRAAFVQATWLWYFRRGLI